MQDHSIFKKNAQRDQLAADVDRFLAKGGKVQQVPAHARKGQHWEDNSHLFDTGVRDVKEVLP